MRRGDGWWLSEGSVRAKKYAREPPNAAREEARFSCRRQSGAPRLLATNTCMQCWPLFWRRMRWRANSADRVYRVSLLVALMLLSRFCLSAEFRPCASIGLLASSQESVAPCPGLERIAER